MKKTGKWFVLLAALVLPGLCRPALAGDSDPVFQFEFAQNHSLVYGVVVTEKNMTDINGVVQGRTQSSITRTTSESHCKVRLTPRKKNPDGTWLVRYEPFDYTVTLDSYSPKGHTITSLYNGLEVKGTQNGIVTIDTIKDIGMQQAIPFKQTLYPQMLSGFMNLTSTGKVAGLGGDLPFVDFWTSQLKLRSGLFGLLFNGEPVAPGASWDETLALKNSQGLKFGDGGLVETNTYSRSGKSDADTATIYLTAALDCKNIPASMDQLGQNTAINISEMSSQRNGTFEFDYGAGKLIDASSTMSFRCSMDTLVQGSSMNVTVDVDNDTKITLLPEEK